MELAGRTLLGKYRIEGLIGQGGMGTVWRGAHVVTARKVAIKVLDERFLSNVNVVQRFGREARAASAIHHEGIVEVLDLDQTEEGLPFLVMEFLEGETIASRIERKKRLSQEETVRIGTMLLEALEAAHQHGVVHRDLKPDNIYLVPAGRRGEIVKILDFGISHKDDEAQAKLTMTGSVLGTPHYMSPEQAMGETTLDKRVDVYGAGVVLYECLVGDVPFDAPNYNKLLRVILDETPVPPSKRGAIVDPHVEQVVLRAIEKDRERRWQSAREVLDALRAATRRTPAAGVEPQDRARRSTASATFARPSSLGAATPTPTPQPMGASGVRARGAAGSLDLAAGDGLAPLELDPAPPPRARAGIDALPPLQLDAVPARGAAPRALAGAPGLGAPEPAASKPLALELDETALAPRTSSSSGQHRAVAGGALAGGASTTGAHRALPEPRSGSDRPPRPRTTSSSSMQRPAPSSAPAGSAPATPDATEEAEPKAPGLGERWAALPDGTRRAIVLGSIGLVLFVAIVGGLRMLVRPGEDDVGAVGQAPELAGEPGVTTPASPEWVLIEVDGVPPGARIWLDGLPGASLPLRVRRGGSHVVEIRAAGYEDRRIEFSAHGNQRVRADMRPAIGTTQQLP